MERVAQPQAATGKLTMQGEKLKRQVEIDKQ